MSELRAAAQALSQALRGQTPAGVTERWPGGPTARRKQGKPPLAQYVTWLEEVRVSLTGATFGQMCQRLRRLYYSDFTDPSLLDTGVGGKFDRLIRGAVPLGEPPLVTGPKLSLNALNGLYGCDAIVTPNGSEIDPSHIFVALDIAQHGSAPVGSLPTVSSDLAGLDWMGTLTWVGDLASWWIQWESDRSGTLTSAQRLDLLEALTESKAGKDDLLGNIDGHVIAGDQQTAATLGLPGIFANYYSRETGAQQPLLVANSKTRFHYFLVRSHPAIGWSVVRNDPFEVELAPDASDQIYQAIRTTALLFIRLGTSSIGTSDLEAGDDMLRAITKRFVAFLEEGLAVNNNAAWPRERE